MTENKEKTRVLFAAFEVAPFIKTGGLADVAGSLPGALNYGAMDVRVVMPKLSAIPEEYKAKMQHLAEFYVSVAWRNQYVGIDFLKLGRVTYYFLDNEYYFKRGNIYGEFDDAERMAFFSKAALEMLRYIDFKPQIIHCNDWHTALIPVYLREQYMGCEGFADIKTVFTIHNLKFQGQYSASIIEDVLGLKGSAAEKQLLQGDACNFLQAAVRYSDAVTTVSPTYAQEIRSDYFGEGLDGIFRDYSYKLRGILNGLNTSEYNPASDKALYVNYDANSLEKKTENKLALQKELGLKEDADIPMLAVVSRLAEQKGFDLLTYNLPKIAGGNFQLVILGTGEYRFEEAFSYYAGHCENMCLVKGFSEALARKIYAASDLFLMPSRFEPCGLSQLIAMRYGSLPVVRETGGLKDTVEPYNKFTGEGSGFSFANYNADEFWSCVENALWLYSEDRGAFRLLQIQAMEKDSSWKSSAKEYRKLYKELL